MASSHPPRKGKGRFSLFSGQKRISDFFIPSAGNKEDVKSPSKSSGPLGKRQKTERHAKQAAGSSHHGTNTKQLCTGFVNAGTMLPVESSVSKTHQGTLSATFDIRNSTGVFINNAVGSHSAHSLVNDNQSRPRAQCTTTSGSSSSSSSTVVTVAEPELPHTVRSEKYFHSHAFGGDRTVFVTGPVDDEVSEQQNRRQTGTVMSNNLEDYDDVDNFRSLPVELMENIFCQLPMVDLMLNCVLVCHQWYDVISNDKFIPWKKRYCRLKHKAGRTEDEVFQMLDQACLLEEDFLVVHLARFMKEFRRDNSSLLHYLKQHPKFPLISKFLENQSMSQCNHQQQSCWSAVGLLTLVSSTVQDVTQVIRCLLSSSLCLVQEILECMYCLATVFYALHTQNRITIGLHYRVFYALYLFENSFAATRASLSSAFSQKRSGQQCITKYRCSSDRIRLTHEQIRLVNHDVNPGDIIKIVAFAGTGKTTTLVEFTKIRPEVQFLNVAYNKSIQQHAAKVFPVNVTSRTVHSLAYRSVGYRYRAKLKGSLRLSSIMNVLPGKGGFLHAQRVLDTLGNFIASADPSVNARHVPLRNLVAISAGDGLDEPGPSYFNSPQYIQQVVEHVIILWQKMVDLKDHDVSMTHDGYLKLYQLEKPTIHGFDCLLIDEAQDCTPAASDILLRQSCAKILVGDPNQQIYSFRGARNAMREVQSSHTFYLTQSFRFGPEIAYVAACTLDALKGIHDKTLVGGGQPGAVSGDTVGQLAIITRCNYTLFNEAVKVCCANNDTRVAFAGGLQSYSLDRVLDIYRLFSADKTKLLEIRDNFIKKFPSFSALRKFAIAAQDAELLGKIKIVETHHVMTPTRIEKIRSKTCRQMEQAKIIFSTAHKAKGLEFDSVRLTDDFLMDGEVPFHEHQEDEKNLVYVAVTRAKKSLLMTRTLLQILASRKEYFVEAALPKQVLPVRTSLKNKKLAPLLDDRSSVTCVQCKVEELLDDKSQIIVIKEQIKLGNGETCPGGILCSSCALKTTPHLSCLIWPSVQ